MAWYDETHGPARPCLVVAPVSLLQNWRAEVTKFLRWSDDDVLSLYGEGASRYRARGSEIPQALSEIGVRKLLRPGFEIGRKLVLTTYETLRDFELSIAKVHWGVVVCDEAQKIKNPAAFVTQAAKALRADFKIACTGTPVENSLADLWCLFDFFQPGSLGSLGDFTRAYRQDIETRAEGYGLLVETLRAGIEPWVLRRLKSEVASDLPKKIDADHPDADTASQRLRMSSGQARLYGSAVEEFRHAQKSSDKRDRSQILALLAKLRMICAHPAMELRADHETIPVATHLDLSPKLAWVLDQLIRIRELDEKAIVFSEFRDVQRLLQRAVSEILGVRATIINGSTSVDVEHDHSRQRIIDRFQQQDGFGVLILSTTAVGFGVNIQAANHVIHFTRPWNPAKEDQATDRAYRIGQTKDVFVYCPIVVGDGFESFEQRLDELLRSKRSLSRDMLAGAQDVSASEFEGI
jgi:SNF2 family DNA or RNA helicase